MSSIWAALVAWLQGHDLTLDLITVWAFAVGFGILALVELLTWVVMLNTVDATPVGRSLRPKKLSYFVVCSAMCTLYSLTLVGYYTAHEYSFWDRLAVRFFGIGGVIAAVICGVVFVARLIHERMKGTSK